MNSSVERIGVGTALTDAVFGAATEAQCTRVWLVTTNDNTAALAFWQRRGFQIVAVYPDAMTEGRRIKPEIPSVGLNGIAIRDEIELDHIVGAELKVAE